ncbi:MAG TPA: serine hydrolase domain-containing protein [Allosphingosinicella sp.]|nr:serine hydrolase domain-containing protein [Allosphingosinicella sp.]
MRRTIAIEGREDERFPLAARMAHYRVPGVSFAVIDNCRIVDARGFGRSAAEGGTITRETLFQAGSVSKPVAAVAALRLVEDGRLSLDADVRARLTAWSVPDSPLLAGRRVTLRGLLSHTSGTNLPGMNGYEAGASLPTIAQILQGRPPSNTPPIRVESAPGAQWRYSGGGYVIAQALMTNATGETFPELMDRLVLEPAGMTSSSFRQPMTVDRRRRAAHGTSPDGSPLPEQWRIYPEMAAAGLWTTPTDLGRFAISVARSIRGEKGGLLRPETARQMMTRGLGNWGLGVHLGPSDSPRQFSHTGRSIGFTSMLVMYPATCQGAAVMTNGDEGGWLIHELMRSIGDAYGWPERRPSQVQAAIELTDAIAARFVGTYRLRDHPAERFVISRKSDGGLYWAREHRVGRDLLPRGEMSLFSPDSVMTLETVEQAASRATTLRLGFGGGVNMAERID